MLSQEQVKKIRQLEIHTRRLLNGTLMGDSRSAIKGSGFDFDQIRDYQMGDDVRFIDWSSSLRMNKLLVKQYTQERSKTIVLALDRSASGLFTSSDAMRADVMAQIASTLALVADYGKDHVGLVVFTDTVEFVMAPNKGRSHVHRLMENAFNYTKPSKGTTTELAVPLDYIARMPWRDVTVIVISDFIAPTSARFERALRVIARKHDVVALRCLDTHEYDVPAVGIITVEDPETGQQCVVDMSKKACTQLKEMLAQRLAAQQRLFKKYNVGHVDIAINKPFFNDLVRFFRRRMMY
jgi:uncharacterized protein (DUF58 family)